MSEIPKAVLENVFICKLDESVVVADAETHKCPVCKRDMENAGWFEAGRGTKQ